MLITKASTKGQQSRVVHSVSVLKEKTNVDTYKEAMGRQPSDFRNVSISMIHSLDFGDHVFASPSSEYEISTETFLPLSIVQTH